MVAPIHLNDTCIHKPYVHVHVHIHDDEDNLSTLVHVHVHVPHTCSHVDMYGTPKYGKADTLKQSFTRLSMSLHGRRMELGTGAQAHL